MELLAMLGAVATLATAAGSVQAQLTYRPEPDDQTIDLDTMTLYVQHDLSGLVDVEEPHDRLVLRPLGSPPNSRGDHH